MTSTRSESPGGLYPLEGASVILLEPAHKGALQNRHSSSRNNSTQAGVALRVAKEARLSRPKSK